MFAIASPSSSSSSRKYEVFLSFRGEDTRRSFTSHLHTALCVGDIETYIDYELPKGDDISQSLMQAIQDSSISMVVFSENYASSKWCLNELLQILRCKQHQAQIVVPIFYEIDPSHVRNQKGTYEKAFSEHFKKNPEKVEEWRQALFEIASLAGWDSGNYRDEAELIQNIVMDINKKLNHGSPTTVLDNIVGIDYENLDHIELLLKGFSMVGIWGMAGIGKTTMAKAMFTKLHSQFHSCCFLENFREESEKHGLKYVHDKLFHELLKDTSLKRLSHRKVLIVLDDVSNTRQLDYLESEAPLLGRGSKVIITSRDKHVLDGRVERIHEAKALSYNNSLKVFNLKAFCKDGYKSEYEELVERALAYAQGVPLALTILGSFLYSRTVKEWESALRKLERTPHRDIQAVLKLSYDGLDDEDKQIFLDIACFFKGELRSYVEAMLEYCGFEASNGLRTLMDKALISVSCDAVWMHDLIQSMAFDIIHQECITNPGGRSRLWKPDEIYDVLKNDRGNDAIQAISLDLSQIKDLELSADVFRKMPNLRFLKFHYSHGHEGSCTVNLSSGLESLPNSLRCLQWDNFPSKCLPLSFCAEKLVVLRMQGSHLEKLWDGMPNFVKLREIDLAGSKQLIELPDFSTAQNLKQADLTDCESLRHLHPSILSLPRLRDLKLCDCRNLKSLKCESPSKSLLHLDVCGCSSLKEFSFSSDKMEYLSLEGTCVEILDFSIGRMEKLKGLCLNGSTLKNLPINDICYMRSLEELHLYDCGGTIDKSKLHGLFDALLSLQTIDLSGTCKLTELPNNTKHLSRLQHLNVSGCKDLQSLPELPPSIEVLDAVECTSLKTLQFTSHIESSLSTDEITPGSNFKHLSNLERIKLSNCRRLRSLPELPPFFEHIDAQGCISLETHVMESAYFLLRRLVYAQKEGCIYYSGRKAPGWFRFNQAVEASKNITIELPFPTSDLIGFIFCCVLSRYPPTYFECKLYVGDGFPWITTSFMGNMTNLDSHQVFLWCRPCTFRGFHNKMDDQNTNYRPKLLFEFSLVAESGDVDGVIEECGVLPIYASEYPNFIQQMELQSNLGTQKETCHDADENSFNGILKYASFSLNQGKCGNFEGSLIPEWFTYKSSTMNYDLSEVRIGVQFALDFDNLMGFIFCFVIPQFSSKKRDECHSSCYFNLHDLSVSSDRSEDRSWIYGNNWKGPLGWHYSMVKLNSDNVFLWYDPLYSELILQKLRKKGKGHDEELEFKFHFGDYYTNNCNSEEYNCWIKECGVRPIHVSEYKNFLLQQKKLKGGMKKKRPRNIDDDQYQLPLTKKLKESSIIQSIPQNPESKTSHDVDKVLLLPSQLNLESTKDHSREK
ncbi:disease resistance protein RML1A-like [Neltuma alba]|uniref:disease resistance protein RML1A-like n=1 Tax=Neltuma alba TaxID=207710 RepID=UPI0010A33EE3|nr:disease resistance protein RML1A-like [Prosopis alba]